MIPAATRITNRPVMSRGGRPSPVSLNSLRDLTVESLDFWGQIRNRVLDAPDGCVVKDLNVAFSHRAQDPPSRSRRDDVPHYQNVQGCSQTTGDLEGDGRGPSVGPDHDRVLGSEFLESLGQSATRVRSVSQNERGVGSALHFAA